MNRQLRHETGLRYSKQAGFELLADDSAGTTKQKAYATEHL